MIAGANAAARAWCVEVNAAVHSEICAVPDERLLIERELVQPLPSLRLQVGAPSVLRKVDRRSTCSWAGPATSGSPSAQMRGRATGTAIAISVASWSVSATVPRRAPGSRRRVCRCGLG